MKYIIYLLLFINQVHAQRIDFIEKFELDNIIQKSDKPLILIDFYTTWCGPCKRMDREVFTDSSIIKQVNSNCISLKVNAEEGQGISLAKKYNVTSYPTYLFLNNQGVLVYRTVGYMSSYDFSQQIANAIIESKESITVLELDSLFKQKSHDLLFLKDYLSRRTKLKLDNSDLLDHYIQLLPREERIRTETLQLLIDNGNRINKSLQVGIGLETLIDNKQKLQSLKNAYPIEYYIENARKKTLGKAIEFKSDSLLNLVLKYTDKKNIFDNISTVKLKYFSGLNNKTKFYKEADSFIKNQLSKYTLKKMAALDSIVLLELINSEDYKDATPEEIQEAKLDYKHTQSVQFVRLYNSITDYIIDNDNNIDHLLAAKKWAKNALDICLLDTTYFKNIYPHSLNNLAKVHYKLKDQKEAIRYQTLAIAASKVLEESDATEMYQKQLMQMKKGKLIVQ
ncbi:MAG: thioredoxin family protein [Sediminibacterium sp.]|uniref:thioredoxin family protein n=1 Tax=Sediminibacterium sp. TaxID=1917865 RepID=UPI002ABBF595|nr:thioredoxin family protein [Sediminibacterium sp.]MDZ4071500.1 thioredoxin family protein [Sediminibacterium sp.]